MEEHEHAHHYDEIEIRNHTYSSREVHEHTHVHRNLNDVNEIIDRSSIDEKSKELAKTNNIPLKELYKLTELFLRTEQKNSSENI